MKGLRGTSWSWSWNEVLAPQCRAGDARTAGPVLLAPFSTGLPPELLDRLRTAARQLGLGPSEIAACTIDLFLAEEGF